MNNKLFKVDFNRTKLIGDIISENNQSRLLCLHGGGPIGRKNFDVLRELLFKNGISSCAFDFIGHGETAGDITTSSLEIRVKQVLAVVQSQALPQPLSIVASSMSGHIAIKLSEFLNIKNIILIAPAVYASKVYSVFFGPTFSEIIREQYSWRDSDIWGILKNYTGNILIFAAEKDQIIPNEIIERIYNSAINANSKEIVMFKDATHSLIEWLNNHQDCLEQVSDKICDIMQK